MSKLQKLFLKPTNKDVLVHNIETGKPLNENGEMVLDTRYWQRRIKDGDVQTASVPKAKQGTNKENK